MAFMELVKFPARSAFPATGDNNRLYIDLHSKRIYYWERGAYQIASPDIVEQGSNPISEAFSYAGIAATVALLPAEGNRIGDVYIVRQDEGHEQNSSYVWSGTEWIEIGGDMEHLVAISWSALKTLRDTGELVPGTHYRITDFVTTTAQADTQSAEHPFDLIVVADDVNKLNENARACLHEGDIYFADSKLESWKLKYCLDNDTNRFAWADEEDGKGVIYRMIDEWNNDVPYDFKNIQFLRDDEFYYTFTDDLVGNSYSNKIGVYISSNKATLNANTFGTGCNSNTFGTDCNNNTFGNSCNSNTFGNNCNSNTFGNGCYSNIFGNECRSNTFGNDYIFNTFGIGCESNTFGNGCYSNTFGNECRSNTFGDGCTFNTFGIGCHSNTFGNGCYSNTFGNECRYNTFGDGCTFNTFGIGCHSNTFGGGCYSNTFGTLCRSNTFGNDCSFNTFGNDCTFNKITGDNVKRISVDNGIQGASDADQLELYDADIANKTYQVNFKQSATGKYLMLWATDTGAMTGKYKALNTDLTWTDIA